MMISAWRYSHFALAVSSFLFLTIAALSGIVLAFEPVVESAKPYRVAGFDTITLARSLPVLRQKLDGIQELNVDENGFVSAKFTGINGNDTTMYINPLTGETLAPLKPQLPLFEWMTALHRSLFLHEAGRAMVGITAFLLIMIALSGIGLVLQRQKSWRKFFAPIEKTSFAQYYHTVSGRYALFFILALALTGAWLSASRFILKPVKAQAVVNEANIRETPELPQDSFPIFRQTLLAETTSVQFPFSEFPEDYYTVKLDEREIAVNQLTGDILAQASNSNSYQLSGFALEWHAARGNPIWAIILAITSGYILFFIFSGAVIAWKRISSRTGNRFKPEESRVIILVGSENGSTYRFASAVYRQLVKQGVKAFITDPDKYRVFPKAEHLVVMTSTYGEGDPPSNAKHFLDKLAAQPQAQTVQFSVLGFGARSYQHFCEYARQVQLALQQQIWANSTMDMVTVNDVSLQDFSHWLTAWSQVTGYKLLMPRELLKPAQQPLKAFTVTEKTDAEINESFLVRLSARGLKKVQSGDLLAIYPRNDHRERLYSIGMVNGGVQLSIKRLAYGLGSGHLYGLQKGQRIRAKIIRNKHFHLPVKASEILMICNGTGIAPFLGMMDENRQRRSMHLYAGFRNLQAFQPYAAQVQEALNAGRLSSLKLALSREAEKQYVTQLLEQDEALLWQVLNSGGVLMICGSLAMQAGVLAVTNRICLAKGNRKVEDFTLAGQILTDCY